MKKQFGFTIIEIIVAVVGIAGAVGWIWNIVKFVHTCCAPIDGMLVVRGIGIFVPPLGAVMGYL